MTCIKCGSLFEPSFGPGRPARYCSYVCKRLVEFELRRIDRRLAAYHEQLREEQADRAAASDAWIDNLNRTRAQRIGGFAPLDRRRRETLARTGRGKRCRCLTASPNCCLRLTRIARVADSRTHALLYALDRRLRARWSRQLPRRRAISRASTRFSSCNALAFDLLRQAVCDLDPKPPIGSTSFDSPSIASLSTLPDECAL